LANGIFFLLNELVNCEQTYRTTTKKAQPDASIPVNLDRFFRNEINGRVGWKARDFEDFYRAVYIILRSSWPGAMYNIGSATDCIGDR